MAFLINKIATNQNKRQQIQQKQTKQAFIPYLYLPMTKFFFICYAPRAVKWETVEEFEKNKKERRPSTYWVAYNKSTSQDDGEETIYTVGLFKQIGGRSIRGEKDLKEVINYFKRHNSKDKKRIQFLNLDKINEAVEKEHTKTK